MAAVSIIASQTAAANSADQTVASGTTVTLSLRAAAPSMGYDHQQDAAIAYVQLKTSDGVYINVGHLSYQEPGKAIVSPGVYRVSKVVTQTAVGVDIST